MIVCVCRRVSDRDIAREVQDGCLSFDALQDELQVGTACGACSDCARTTFDSLCGSRHAGGRNAVMMAPQGRAAALGTLG
jgi:bacterioferritin-associated ferredoxin